MPPVELHTALMFECHECGRENFVRLAHPALDDEEIEEICDEKGIPNDGGWMFTFCHDQEAKATTFRRARLKAAQRTIRLLNQSLPPSLRDLAEGFQFDWDEASPHTNLVSNTNRRATAIALDENHGRDDAERTRDKVAEYLRRTSPTANESIDAMQRLSVWYRDEQGRDVLCEPHRFVNYDQTVESPVDIGRAS